MLLVVAATEFEADLVEPGRARVLVCGVGPVEAAARTAAVLAASAASVDAVLNVGLAGARAFDEPRFVVGSEAIYCDADNDRWIELRIAPDESLAAAAARALPAASVEPIGTAARVGGTSGCEIEAMEGYAVLRAAALARVPAVEVRVVVNAIGEHDRGKWRFAEGRALLAESLPALVDELSRA